MNPNYYIHTISRSLYEEAYKRFPCLRERADYAIFFWYLCLGANFDRHTGKLLLCRDAIASLIGREPKNFKAREFFEEFRKDVVGESNFLWHEWYNKRCRQLARLSLGNFEELLTAELQQPQNPWKRVCLDGKIFNTAKARKIRAAERGIAKFSLVFDHLLIQKLATL
jgi:hypothetical protein